jgi:hypothetical protein
MVFEHLFYNFDVAVANMGAQNPVVVSTIQIQRARKEVFQALIKCQTKRNRK